MTTLSGIRLLGKNEYCSGLVVTVFCFSVILLSSAFTFADAAQAGVFGMSNADMESFPGIVPEDAVRTRDQQVDVPFTIQSFGYLRTYWPPGSWISTGLYAPPGEEISINVPIGTPRLLVQIGAHTDKLIKLPLKRDAEIVVKQDLQPGINTVKSQYGGLIYFIPQEAKAGHTSTIKVNGAVKAPYFILGKTSPESWSTIRDYSAPWAELQCSGVIITVPSASIRTLNDPITLMSKWDEIIRNYERLVGLSPEKPEPNRAPSRPFRFVADVQISNGWMHSGYPIMLTLASVDELVDVAKLQHDAWGIWHELGHDFQQYPWYWGSVIEVTGNIFSVYTQTKYGNPSRLLDKHNGKSAYDKALEFVTHSSEGRNYHDNTQIDVFARLVMFMQLQQAYGWDFYTKVYTAYREMPQDRLPKTDQEKIDCFVVTASKVSGEDLLEFFDQWAFGCTVSAKQQVESMQLKKPGEKIWLLSPALP